MNPHKERVLNLIPENEFCPMLDLTNIKILCTAVIKKKTLNVTSSAANVTIAVAKFNKHA